MTIASQTPKQGTTWSPKKLTDESLASWLLTWLALQDQAAFHHSDYIYKAADLYDARAPSPFRPSRPDQVDLQEVDKKSRLVHLRLPVQELVAPCTEKIIDGLVTGTSSSNDKSLPHPH